MKKPDDVTHEDLIKYLVEGRMLEDTARDILRGMTEEEKYSLRVMCAEAYNERECRW